ncbi:hypothetical protein [Methylobacterium sp. Leaf456]|uniref:hypothetical protein n=1 Tax=Methylobacterium sp. Leaf456 TaxID=1736382 RepID=UPI0012E34565|nr:hypothetical protein [Methylobacterium sp. Leaf456]
MPLFVGPPICPELPAAYRVLVLSASGHILLSESISAKNDGEAVAQARRRAGAASVELWDGVRFMEHFPPLLEPAS